MNSLPVIEGINNLKTVVEGLNEPSSVKDEPSSVNDEPTSVKDKYIKFLEDLRDFYGVYNSGTTPSISEYSAKLEALKLSLNEYKDTFKGLSEIVKNKYQKGDAEELIKENRSRMLDDNYIKQESSYYYNLVINIFLACVIYYIFFEINYRK